MSRAGGWQGLRHLSRTAPRLEERVEWAWARYRDAHRRAEKDPGDRSLAAAIVSRRGELDALLVQATVATRDRIAKLERERRRLQEEAS